MLHRYLQLPYLRPYLLPATFLLTLTACLSGCKTFWSSPEAPPIIASGVLTGIVYAESKGVPAAQINAVCKQVLAADSSGTATMAELSTLLNTKLESIKGVSQYVGAIAILESAFTLAINEQVAANPTVATVQTDAAVFLNDCVVDTGG